MIVWGSNGREIHLGFVEERECETCGKTQPFELSVVYKYFHLYWVFRVVTQRQFWFACPVCRNGWQLDAAKAQASLGRSPIPIWDRYGLGIVGAGACILVAWAIAAAPPIARRNPQGVIAEPGSVDVFQMRVGDCFNDSRPLTLGQEPATYKVSNVAGLPCSQAHDLEVYAVLTATVRDFPGPEGMRELADQLCLEQFETFVGLEYASSALDIVFFLPTEESWRQRRDREVVCCVTHVDGRRLAGSAKGSGL
jgi:hypothetical protein